MTAHGCRFEQSLDWLQDSSVPVPLMLFCARITHNTFLIYTSFLSIALTVCFSFLHGRWWRCSWWRFWFVVPIYRSTAGVGQMSLCSSLCITADTIPDKTWRKWASKRTADRFGFFQRGCPYRHRTTANSRRDVSLAGNMAGLSLV